MRLRPISILVLAACFSGMLVAQDAPQGPPADAGQNMGQGGGQRGGRGWGRGMGSGVSGTVTEIAADHFTIKNFAGETWTIHYSANTRIAKQPPRPEGAEQQGPRGAYVPNPIKASDVKVGDTIMAAGDVDQSAKSVGAVGVMVVDPARARQMQEMQANYGKTWLMGRVTAVEETKVTIEGGMDHAPHTFVADENTSFRKRREPVTLADVQVGEMVRVDGAMKDGQFVATTVNVMGQPGMGGPGRGGPGMGQGQPPQSTRSGLDFSDRAVGGRDRSARNRTA